jgi:hypothetical protein
MNKEKMKQLLALQKSLRDVIIGKRECVERQLYEEAAKMRDVERTILSKVDDIVDINHLEEMGLFQGFEKREFYKIIDFIKEEDKNLTPALLRKLSNDIRRVEEDKAYLKEMMVWNYVHNKRPNLKNEVEIDGKTWVQSDEVIVFYIKSDGEHDVCIARYVEEKTGIYDKKYYFVTRNSENSINLNEIKGWQDIQGEAKAWASIPENKIK